MNKWNKAYLCTPQKTSVASRSFSNPCSYLYYVEYDIKKFRTFFPTEDCYV